MTITVLDHRTNRVLVRRTSIATARAMLAGHVGRLIVIVHHSKEKS